MIMGRNFDHTHFLVLSYSSTLAFMNWKYSRVLPLFCPTTAPIVVTTGIKSSSNIGNALVSAMYGWSSELSNLVSCPTR